MTTAQKLGVQSWQGYGTPVQRKNFSTQKILNFLEILEKLFHRTKLHETAAHQMSSITLAKKIETTVRTEVQAHGLSSMHAPVVWHAWLSHFFFCRVSNTDSV